MATGTLRGVGNIVGVKPNKKKKKVKGVVGGLSGGVDDLSQGIMGGVAQLINNPVQGWRKQGVFGA